MRRILSTKLYRFIEMVEYVLETEESVPLATLAQHLNCSSRILREYAVEINQVAGRDLFTLTIANEKISMQRYPDTGLDLFYRRVMALSNELQILEYIFFHPRCSVAEIAEALYLSLSTVYRNLKKISVLLSQEFDIILSTNPCTFVANEWNIRYFFGLLFEEKYALDAWPYAHLNFKDMETFAQDCVTYSPVLYDYFPSKKMIHLFSVAMVRYAQGYSSHAYPTQSLLETLAPKWGKKFQLQLSLAETEEYNVLSDIVSCINAQRYFLDFEEFDKASQQDATVLLAKETLEQQLEVLNERHELVLNNLEQVILAIYNISQLTILPFFSKVIIMKQNREFFAEFRERFPRFFEDLFEVLKVYQQTMGQNDNQSALLSLGYIVCATYDHLSQQLLAKLPRLKVLVVSNVDLFHAKLMESYLTHYLSNLIETEPYFDTVIRSENIERKSCDVVVTNEPISNYYQKPVLVTPVSIEFNDPETLSMLYEMASRFRETKYTEY